MLLCSIPRLQTSAADVYAAGDIAAFPLKMDGGRYVRQEHVQNGVFSAQSSADVG